MLSRRVVIGLLGLGALSLGACARPVPLQGENTSSAEAGASASASAQASTSAAPAAVPAATTTSTAAPAAAGARWADAVRLERWDEAEAELDALPEAERQRPEMKYVRGRVALERGDFPRVVELLTGLDKELPLLADDILRRRAEAAVEAGPFAEAAAFFGKSRTPADLGRAALALEKDGQLAPARAILDRALALAAKSRKKTDDAPLRATRARIAEAQGSLPLAIADLRWLAVEAAGLPEGEAAVASLGRLKQSLAPKDQLARALGLIRSGHADQAIPVLDELEKKKALPLLDVLHARAEAKLKARDYPGAEKAFRLLSTLPGPRKVEAMYLAATALARSGQVDEAIKRWLDLSSKYKKNSWAERALYQAARHLLLRGRYDEAAPLYTRYLALFPKGMYREDAPYEQALAQLSAGQAKTAQKTLARLAKAAKKADEAQKLHELEGLAAFRAGHRDEAVRIWTDVARAFPLSFAALAARSRLAAAGAPLPPLIEPGAARPANPLDLELPDPARLLVSLGLDAEAEGRLVPFEREASARFAGREAEALCGMYGKLMHARRRYRVGVAHVGLPTLLRAPGEADRWAWECLYPRPYLDEVRKLEAEHEVPRGLVHSLMRQESAFDQEALSPVFAVGLLQLMPKTAEKAAAEVGMSFEPTRLKSPHVNLRLGSYYIGKLLKTFQKNPVLAVAAYNAGPKAVGNWTRPGVDAEADLWVARIPYDETRNYVARVLGNLARYQWMEGGDAAVQPLPLEMPGDVEVPADAY
ncbi:transglycosylase SLT domain-containing protein [Polyangium spumosum]|uniref:Transglycosylase SLT domain-containing protein n=1 Tax=Polyangium spumosum TaxID=889282 RepID=A0A6N7PNS0_9BACT|nr:transglycosylase SLT domain-containing protein [Polyangium spumosum]MRG92456.1 transglycosylase SLT domain-containing protein [Polyangium spumosum]